MPFRIDCKTQKNDVDISLQVVKNQINFYFKGKRLDVIKVRDNMWYLIEHIYALDRGRRYRPLLRGKDAEHIKRHHSNERDTNIFHLHVAHHENVNPKDLSFFLNSLLSLQKKYPSEQYQFISQEEVKEFVNVYSCYYESYKGSATEKQYLEDTRLTDAEKKSLMIESLNNEKKMRRDDYLELSQCSSSALSASMPMFRPHQSSSSSAKLASSRTIELQTGDDSVLFLVL